jgi:hypothetical protein
MRCYCSTRLDPLLAAGPAARELARLRAEGEAMRETVRSSWGLVTARTTRRSQAVQHCDSGLLAQRQES